MDALITAGVVTSALAFIVWRAWPRRKAAGCAGCSAKR
jgi:hypothetical protein